MLTGQQYTSLIKLVPTHEDNDQENNMNTANETQAMVVGGSSGIGYQTAKQLMPSTPPGVSAHPKTLPAPSAFFFPARQTGSPGPYGTLMAVLLPEGTETGTTEFGADHD